MDTIADTALFAQTVPLFADYAPRLLALARSVDETFPLAGWRLVPDTFSAGEHLVVAQGFVLRTIFPVLGRDRPALSTEEPTVEGIARRHTEITEILEELSENDFAGAAARRIQHVAGDAELEQHAIDYIRLFGVPNFFFHFTMGYATLRAAGVEVGKERFDGLHAYAPGFSFTS